jgi:hypothetical protein
MLFEKLKSYIAEMREEEQKRKEEQERLEKERRAKAAAEEAARIAAEQAKIQAEYDRLMSMTEKELLVEAVLALRGIYSQMEELSDAQERLDSELSSMAEDIERLENEVEELQYSSDD